MSKQDFRLNDFEIKTIKLNCPNHILKFEQIQAGDSFFVSYTRIEAFSLKNEFCMSTNSSAIDHNEFKWIKYDIDKISNAINASKPVIEGAIYKHTTPQVNFRLGD